MSRLRVAWHVLRGNPVVFGASISGLVIRGPRVLIANCKITAV